MKKIAIILDSPYNTMYKRLEVINAGDNFTPNPVKIVSVDYYNPEEGYPYCIYKGERYDYKNGQYYHPKYMERGQ